MTKNIIFENYTSYIQSLNDQYNNRLKKISNQTDSKGLLKLILSRYYIYSIFIFLLIFNKYKSLHTRFIKIEEKIQRGIYISNKFLFQNIFIKQNFIFNIKKFCANYLEKANYTVLSPRFKIDLSENDKNFLYKKTGCPHHLYPFQRETFLCCFEEVKFIGKTGGLIIKNLPMVDSVFNFSRFIRLKPVDNFILKYRKMKGVYTSIMHRDYDNLYYHFLIDTLPRFYAISKIKESKKFFIVPKDLPKYQKDIIKIFLDKRFKIISIDKNEIWELEKYYFPSFCTGDCSGYMPKNTLNFVRNKIFDHFGLKETSKKHRVYVSRKYTSSRRIKNEKEVIDLLEKYDFQKIYAEKLSFKEKVKLFYSTTILVGAFGSNQSNIILCNNCKLLDLFPPNHMNAHIFFLTKALGFEYYYLNGEEEDKNRDFRVNILELEEKIKKMI